MRTLSLIAATTVAVLSFACGGGDGDGDDTTAADAATAPDAAAPDAAAPDAAAPDAAAPDAAPAASHLTVHVPDDFAGTTRQLVVVYHPQPTLSGAPTGSLYRANAPALTAGADVDLAVDPLGVTGTYYVTTVLYMVGGGQFVPASGIDYLATSSTSFEFDGGPMDLGAIDLALAP